MLDPIVRRNLTGGVTHAWRLVDAYGERPTVVVEDAGGSASWPLDDEAALDAAIQQLCMIRNSRRLARSVVDAARDAVAERQSQRPEDASWHGYGVHGCTARLSADGDRFIDRGR